MDSTNYKDKYPAAFPKLTPDQMEAVSQVAECKTYQDGDVLLKAGDTEFRFHVIQKGEIKIIDRSDGTPSTILVHEAYEFTGDIANLAGRTSNVDAVAQGTVEVYEVCTDELRLIISAQPELSDIILKAFIARDKALEESDFTGFRVIGHESSKDTFRIRDFLSKNSVLFTWIDLQSENDVGKLIARFHITENDFPIVAYGNEWILKNPTTIALAEKLGIRKALKEDVYDLAIVGGGPAGLAAAVYGASEGLKTVILERLAPGGQAGASSKIENYLGFPTGLSGAELAERATMQAEKFGAQLSIPSVAVSLSFDNNLNVLELENGEKISSRTLLIASGAEYKKLPIDNLEKYEGRGVYYAATKMEATMCGQSTIAIVGGGNSAGQAAVFLSSYVEKIYLIIRGESLSLTMSHYLEHRIGESDVIEVLANTEIEKISGDDLLESISIVDKKNNERRDIKLSAIFSFIGAFPCTGWLPPEIETDEKGFVITGPHVHECDNWTLKRQPFLLETSKPGVFAAGDVRSHSIKRVASAVGEGSMVVQFVHEFIRATEPR